MTDVPQSADLLKIAIRAAESVAGDLRTAFRAQMEVSYKRDEHDPVTVHDKAAEAKIRRVILDAVPDSTIVGEEDGRKGNGRVHWYVDPIDGTANFARGLAFFCTSIGAVVDGEIVAGVVLDPVAGHLFAASTSGATLNGEPMHARGHDRESRAVIIASYPSSRDLHRDGPESLERFGRIVAAYGTVRRPGSAALTLAHVAAGWVDAALGGGVNSWDICAGRLLVEQAGGTYDSFGATPGAGTPSWTAPGYLAHVATLDPETAREIAHEIELSRLGVEPVQGA